MDIRIIAEKYEITDTLFSNELQAAYTAKLSGKDDSRSFIVNEFKNTDIIYSMKDSFSKEKCRYIRNIAETFYEDFCFYVVCNVCSGPTLEAYLSDNNLRLTEKMYLTDSLFTQLVEMENLSPLIVFSLCDTDNLAVTNKRNICFNCNLELTEAAMSATSSDISRKAGAIICSIFANTVAFDLSYTKDYLPPALYNIVQNLLDGKYESMAKAYNDFKSLLLYSVFMGSGSVDNQIRKNYQKARIKRKLTPVRRLAAIVIILLLAGGIWTVVKDLDIFTINRIEAVNTKPIAQFTAGKGRIYVGDTVVFTSKSTDPDSGDSIKSYLWVVSRDDKPIFNSSDQNIAYTFSETGEYGIHLVVTDTHDEASEPYKTYINVLPKPAAPDAEEEPDTEEYK